MRRKYSIPSIGEKFGRWTVIDNNEEYIYPNSQKTTKLLKGILVQCPHGNTKRRSVSALYNRSTSGCLQCGSEQKFKGSNDLSGSYLNTVILGAKKRGLEYNVTPEYLWNLFSTQNRKCALSGLTITLDPKFSMNFKTKNFTQTASLDRIDNTKGYVEGNVQWLHKWVNFMKLDFNQSEFIELCDQISKNKKSEPRIRIVARTAVEGIHRWLACPIDEVSYLRNYHRHLFHIECKAYVNHMDRDIEFIKLTHDVRIFLHRKYFSEQHQCLFFGDSSCEMLADELIKTFDLYECEVNEDGESGSIVRNM